MKDNDTQGELLTYAGKVRVQLDSSVVRKTKLSVGNIIIPFYSATINLNLDKPATITIVAPLERVDVLALEENTEVSLTKPWDLP